MPLIQMKVIQRKTNMVFFSDVNDGSDSDNDVDIDDHWKEIADNRLN